MVYEDHDCIRALLAAGHIIGPVLDVGAGWGGITCRDIIRSAGLEYFSTDKALGNGVDYAADFESLEPGTFDRKFGTILILNVLEHTFEPIKVMDNAVSLLAPGGRIVTITPSVWALHEYPVDCCRLLPQWYELYAERRGLRLNRSCFQYIPGGRVDAHRTLERHFRYPPPTGNPVHYWWSRIIHRVFNTFGRQCLFPSHVAIAAVFEAHYLEMEAVKPSSITVSVAVA